MWKPRQEEKPAVPVQPAVAPPPVSKEVRAVETPKSMDSFRAEVAHIGKSVIVKGELSGSEDLYLDGEVEGSIELHGHNLTIGPHGRVKANVHARDIVVHGKVDGNLRAKERIELKKSAVVMGDIFTQRIVIEDGAYFKGAIDIQRDAAKTEPKVAAAAASSSMSPTPVGATASAGSAQGSLLEPKKY